MGFYAPYFIREGIKYEEKNIGKNNSIDLGSILFHRFFHKDIIICIFQLAWRCITQLPSVITVMQ